MEQRPAENLIGAESTDGCTHQHQILPALGVAPQTVIGLEQKLSNDGAPIQQQHIFREAAFGADLGIRQQYCDELVTCHCHCEQKRIAEEQQLFPKSAHIGTLHRRTGVSFYWAASSASPSPLRAIRDSTV